MLTSMATGDRKAQSTHSLAEPTPAPRAHLRLPHHDPFAPVRPARLPAAPRAPDLRRGVRGRVPRTPADAGAVRRAHRAQVASGAGPVEPGARAGLRQGDGAAGAARPGVARPGRT